MKGKDKETNKKEYVKKVRQMYYLVKTGNVEAKVAVGC
jgi:hypothetical protein